MRCRPRQLVSTRVHTFVCINVHFFQNPPRQRGGQPGDYLGDPVYSLAMNSRLWHTNLPVSGYETPSEFVVPSLWRTCLNLIGPFIHPTAKQTRSVARRAMPQSHVAPHHLVCSMAQSTRIICQCQLLNEEIRRRGHLSGATARLCMKLLRDRAGASSGVRHMPPRVHDNPRPRSVQCPWLPTFLARLPKAQFLKSRAAQGGGGGGHGGRRRRA